jgi:hypothetical protein
VGIHGTGLVLVLLSNGTLFIERSPTFMPLFEVNRGSEGVLGMFDNDNFALMGQGDTEFMEYDYGVAYPYKEMPTLKAWLVQQKLTLE